ncbi:uncharacterized protein [Garra rufa]|uniref:uncharacterized protein n=1 Tax=Garra rufa TaxID=137080 RepID=UPI003CCE9131
MTLCRSFYTRGGESLPDATSSLPANWGWRNGIGLLRNTRKGRIPYEGLQPQVSACHLEKKRSTYPKCASELSCSSLRSVVSPDSSLPLKASEATHQSTLYTALCAFGDYIEKKSVIKGDSVTLQSFSGKNNDVIQWEFEIKISVKEGDSVTLKSGLTEMKDDDQILWDFEHTLIAEINKQADSITVYNEVLDGRFRDRLKLDEQTGSLTITNITTEHDGDYELLHVNHKRSYFYLTVIARLPVPVISRDSSQCSSSPSSCSLVCLAVNVRDVGLSWYRGNSLISSTSESDLSISLSLRLEVEYQDENSYSCVLNNPVSNQTTHLNITQLCQPFCCFYSSGSAHCCSPTEAVIRLVLSALVGVATVIVLLYDIRSRRAEGGQVQIHT